MNKIQYRSAGLQEGIFSKIGCIHAHIDGADSPEQVRDIVEELEKRGNPGTLDYVVLSVVGPQRAEEPETYGAHTPVMDGEEAFDFFSSTQIHSRQDALAVLDAITTMLAGTKGAIVEIEQNVGWLDEKGWQVVLPADQLEIIHSAEARLAPKDTMRYEIHHAIEIPKSWGVLNLSALARFCRRHQMVFGGWFVFDDGDRWGYWSNAFSNETNIQQLVEREQSILSAFLVAARLDEVKPVTLVERVLGIWHSQGG